VKHYLKHARLLAGALAFIVGATLVAPPAFAAGPAAATTPRPIAAAATAKVAAMPVASLAPAAQASPAAAAPAKGDKPFFKSTKGVVVLVLMATAVSWAAVSRSQDAVHSPARN
jgi:hypothetical protein